MSELLPPPPPPPATAPDTPPATAPDTSVDAPGAVPIAMAPRTPRVGELTGAWRIIVAITWVGAFLAYMSIWKASEEIGIATWWLGPRSNPQPLVVQLIPFLLITFVGILASYNIPRMPWISSVGAVVLGVIAVPDLSRSTGLALIEFAVAGAVLLVSLASFTGTYRRPALRCDETAGEAGEGGVEDVAVASTTYAGR